MSRWIIVLYRFARITLGESDGGRGAAVTIFSFSVEEAGVYFFRLLCFEGGGGANVEWFTMDADGVRSLVGGQQADSVPAFRTRTVPEPTLPTEVVFEEPILAGGQVTLTGSGAGVLQESSDLESWSDVSPQPQENTFTVTPGSEDGRKFHRISAGE